jgi:hypothetical protein
MNARFYMIGGTLTLAYRHVRTTVQGSRPRLEPARGIFPYIFRNSFETDHTNTQYPDRQRRLD